MPGPGKYDNADRQDLDHPVVAPERGGTADPAGHDPVRPVPAMFPACYRESVSALRQTTVRVLSVRS